MKITQRVGGVFLVSGALMSGAGLLGLFNHNANHPQAAECYKKTEKKIDCTAEEWKARQDAVLPVIVEGSVVGAGAAMGLMGAGLLLLGIRKNAP